VNEFWLSWYHDPENGEFELHSPWWTSGYTMTDPPKSTIVAAVRAEDEDAAWAVVRASYDTPPESVIERFCEPLAPKDGKYPWDNPNGRFQRAEWMKW
jgi:hypothetical protein